MLSYTYNIHHLMTTSNLMLYLQHSHFARKNCDFIALSLKLKRRVRWFGCPKI